MYIDDALSGADDEPTAMRLRDELIALLAEACMPRRRFRQSLRCDRLRACPKERQNLNSFRRRKDKGCAPELTVDATVGALRCTVCDEASDLRPE